ERGLLHPAVTGATVARVVPPQPGTPGRDVFGAAIPAAAGRPAPLRLGPGVRPGERGEVIATRDGVIAFQAGSVDVVPLWQHKGDVDLASGNLHAHGSLLVTGDVHEGFLVETDGDVVVQGAVLDACIKAGGNAVIAQSV